jgi:hypothetical protein
MNKRVAVGFSILLIVCASAFSQEQQPPYATVIDGAADKYSVPLSQAMLGFFLGVLNAEDHMAGSGIGMLETNVGLDKVSAEAAFHHIRAAIDMTRQGSAQLVRGLCAERNQIRTNDTFTQKIIELERENDRVIERNVDGLASAVGAENAAAVTRWVDENVRPATVMMKFDREAQFRSYPIDPSAALAKMCDAPKEPLSRGN